MANHFDFEVNRAGKEALILSDMSPLASQVFVNNYYNNGTINEFTRSFLIDECNHLSAPVHKADINIMLETLLDVCLSRIGMRNRDGEQVLDKQWLSSLNMEYDCFLTEQGQEGAQVLHLVVTEGEDVSCLAMCLLWEVEQ